MSLPRYAEYKDSGVEWLGDIPAHWEQFALKRVVQLKSGETIGPDAIQDTGDFPVYGGNGFRGYTDSYTHDGEFPLIGRQGALCGNINYASGRFWASEHAVVAAGKKPLATRWLGELLRTMNLGQYSVSAAQPGLSVEIIGNLSIPFPPPTEQNAIATFLDHETAKIDALIAEQVQLIALLKEKRQAVISHAVTRGLNPDAPMKDSGVEWIGLVPQHWSRTRLRTLYRQEKRQDQFGQSVLSVYRDYGVILKDSRDDNMNKTPDDLSTYQLVKPSDLVVNKMKAWQGSLGVSSLEGITSPDYIVFTPRHEECSDFLHLLLRSQRMVTIYRSISNGIRPSQWRLEPDLFLSLQIFLPPKHEQLNIASFITNQASHFDALMQEAQAAIALLQERRSALISATVTGKIKVCDESVIQEAA